MQVLSVSYARSRADVLYEPEKATVDQMAKALDRFGYKTASIGSKKVNVQQIVIQLKGFGGFEKIPPLEKALAKIPGVMGIDTSIRKRTVTIFIRPGKANRETFVTAITGQGMEVVAQ